MVLLATGAPWKRLSRRVPSIPIPGAVNSPNDGSEVNRLSNVTFDPAFTSHFQSNPTQHLHPDPDQDLGNQYLLQSMVLHE